MPNVYEGHCNASGLKFGIIVSRFNHFITEKLLSGALDALRRHGAADENVDVVWVPGSFEIPSVARRLAQSGKYDALLCLGCVIRGATPHFDYVAGQCASGVAQVGYETGVPTIFGVLTTDTMEQAIERAGTKAGNKGFDAAMAAMEMADLVRQLKRET
ncbi:MAG: 6,7-dimethyl-8-ribityllumazine synthase [Abditibacteriales bacterium]|nr:6,7-dimethyl-8-ribityllumazine synthase [Abditibacteriales bacterium]MDW8368121.1 6,7-dimethyl-8-ribityllumazine synthase [Abditibacteriales bacterium]